MTDKLKDNILKLKIADKKSALIVSEYTEDNEGILLDKVAKNLLNGSDIVIFNPNLCKNDRDSINIASQIGLLCAEFDATFIIKSRADIAYIVNADGILLDNNDIKPENAHEILGHNSIIGISYISGLNNFVDFTIQDNTIKCLSQKIKIKELK